MVNPLHRAVIELIRYLEAINDVTKLQDYFHDSFDCLGCGIAPNCNKYTVVMRDPDREIAYYQWHH